MRSSSKIKITHILTDSNIGGAGRLLRYFLEEADRDQFEYSVILPDDAALIPEIEALGIPVVTAYGIADRSSAPEFQGFLTEKIKKLDCVKDANLAFMAERLTIEVDEENLEVAIAEIRKIIKKIEPDCRLITN